MFVSWQLTDYFNKMTTFTIDPLRHNHFGQHHQGQKWLTRYKRYIIVQRKSVMLNAWSLDYSAVLDLKSDLYTF